MAGLPPRPDELSDELFDRMDPSPDPIFYGVPRLVTHIDDATIAALTGYYAGVLPGDGAVLDLMSSWVSHLPDRDFARVAGLGMNAEELSANPRLTESIVHDLNAEPTLPFDSGSFESIEDPADFSLTGANAGQVRHGLDADVVFDVGNQLERAIARRTTSPVGYRDEVGGQSLEFGYGR